MATDEASFVKDMRHDFESQHALGFWRKIHGSQFQAGFPDVLVSLCDAAALVEFKWVTKEVLAVMPIGLMVVEIVTALQRVELQRIGCLDGPLRARVCVGFPVESEELPYGEGELAFGMDFNDAPSVMRHSLIDLAGIALHARKTGEWPADLPREVQFQLKCRGEAWRASPIAVGVIRYQVREKYDQEGDYES